MNKIKEILEKSLQFNSVRSLQIEGKAIEAMIEFGKICFEAGRDQYWDDGGSGCLEFKHYEYEDFLKEIEDEKGN